MTCTLALAWLKGRPKDALILAGCAILAFLTVHVIQRERQIGRDQVLLAQSDSTQHALADTLKTHDAGLAKAETVMVRQVRHVLDSVPLLLHDTAWVHDTVRLAGDTTLRVAVPETTVVRAKAELLACVELAHDCAAYRDSAGRKIDFLQRDTTAKAVEIGALKRGQPSAVRVWGERLGWVGALFYALTRKR